MSTESAVQWRNPPSGSHNSVAAGETIAIEYSVRNSHPDKVAKVTLDQEGFPETWISKPGRQAVEPDNERPVVIEITPPHEVPEGEYRFSLNLKVNRKNEWTEPKHLFLAVKAARRTAPPHHDPPPDDDDANPGVAPEENENPDGPEQNPVPPPPEDDQPVSQPYVPINYDRAIPNPADGSAISCRPGERILVRITFRDEAAPGELERRKYVIQHDNSLPSGWIEKPQGEVSVGPNGFGELQMLLKPPTTAESGEYPVLIHHGKQGAQLTPVSLVLHVQPIPAVKVNAIDDDKKVWFGKSATFWFEVATDGNEATAYRLAIRPHPQSEKLLEGALPQEIYETTYWRYCIDKELGNLKSELTDRLPEPVKHKVEVRRKGVWWWWPVERHSFTIGAVPVTDVRNANKTENLATFHLTRFRPWPCAAGLFFPALLLLLGIGGSGARDLAVTNAVAQVNGRFYVMADTPVDADKEASVRVKLSWQNSLIPKSPWRVATGKTESVGRSDELSLGMANVRDVSYGISTSVLGSDHVSVVAIAQRKYPMENENGVPFPGGFAFGQFVSDDDIRRAPFKISSELYGGLQRPITEVPIQVREGTIYTLQFQNSCTGASGRTVSLFEVKRPDRKLFEISGLGEEEKFSDPTGSNGLVVTKLGAEDARWPKIRVTKAGIGQTSVWEILTTDARFPVVRFILKGVAK